MEPTVIDNLIPAVVTWVVEHDSYVTKTKLLKLLYVFDVEYYRHRSTFTGFGWKFFHLGFCQMAWAATRKKGSYFKPQFRRLSGRRGRSALCWRWRTRC